MANILDFSISHAQETDYIINVANSNPVNLGYILFYNMTGKKVVISTAAGGGGTVLTETTDWVAGGAFADADLPSSILPDVAYTTIAIVNATYHNTNLYISYYPIGSPWDASLWNNNNILPSEGDNDISAANATLNLTIRDSYPIGDKFRISWHSGDGSNTFSLVDNGETINGISVAQWVGNGEGYLDLMHTASGAFETINQGEIWDSDGGNFTNGTFKKYLEGSIFQTYKSLAVSINTATAIGNIAYTGTPIAAQNYPISVSQVDDFNIKMGSADETRWISTDNTSAAPTTSAWPAFNVADATGSVANADFYYNMSGRWTALYPRKS